MILANAPQHEAILSNVGEIGEFRIRNSAKAFSILSSGLYANKIRAIIRELSCNAVDSHIAAGKKDTPFDVHLPNSLEPWFSIRDYGTGLTHDQVTNIYTTYFESTKTDSNDYIGALGLGSKSPFSYTDNFTVTAIKDGVRGIYSAFINGSGVPSIVKMMDETSTDPNGVEVKFSVNDRSDFEKFRQEASNVYIYFGLRPVISGNSNFKFYDQKYSDKDIIPGVHANSTTNSSVAIMGNIAYPIDIPASDTIIGEYRSLLNCGLVMHFGIGELDFQASREGLSYIPETIKAIRRKLEQVTAALVVRLAADADKIANLWERAIFLNEKSSTDLWRSSVTKYATDTKFPLMAIDCGRMRVKHLTFTVDDLAAKYNIKIRAFNKHTSYAAASNKKTSYIYTRDAAGKEIATPIWQVSVGNDTFFVENDTRVGALVRAKYHWKNTPRTGGYGRSSDVFVMEKHDKSKPMKVAAFMSDMFGPPADKHLLASKLMQTPREQSDRSKNVTIVKLERKDYQRYRRYSGDVMVWRDAGKVEDFDKKTMYYYLPLSNHTIESTFGAIDNNTINELLQQAGIPELKALQLYGVRKGDIAFIKTQKNWVNAEEYIVGKLKALDEKFLMGLVVTAIDSYELLRYNEAILKEVTDKTSPYATFTLKYKDVKKVVHSESHLNRLIARYAPGTNVDTKGHKDKLIKECKVVYDAYPLFKNLGHAQNNAGVAHYINLVNAAMKETK